MLTCSALAVGDLGRILRVHDALLEHLLREPRACSPIGSRSRGRSADTLSLLCGRLSIDNALREAEFDARVSARCNLCGVLSIDDALIDASPSGSRSTNRSADALSLLYGILGVDEAFCGPERCAVQSLGNLAETKRRAASGAASRGARPGVRHHECREDGRHEDDPHHCFFNFHPFMFRTCFVSFIRETRIRTKPTCA